MWPFKKKERKSKIYRESEVGYSEEAIAKTKDALAQGKSFVDYCGYHLDFSKNGEGFLFYKSFSYATEYSQTDFGYFVNWSDFEQYLKEHDRLEAERKAQKEIENQQWKLRHEKTMAGIDELMKR